MESSGYGNNWNSCGNGHVYYIDRCRTLNFVKESQDEDQVWKTFWAEVLPWTWLRPDDWGSSHVAQHHQQVNEGMRRRGAWRETFTVVIYITFSRQAYEDEPDQGARGGDWASQVSFYLLPSTCSKSKWFRTMTSPHLVHELSSVQTLSTQVQRDAGKTPGLQEQEGARCHSPRSAAQKGPAGAWGHDGLPHQFKWVLLLSSLTPDPTVLYRNWIIGLCRGQGRAGPLLRGSSLSRWCLVEFHMYEGEA